MIELEDIVKTYTKGSVSTEVLKGVSFRIEENEFVSIMGPSGTGKSTLMNILGAMDKPTGGRYSLNDTDVSTLDDNELSLLRNRSIGFVFQQFHLLDRASVLRNVMLPLVYEDGDSGDARERAEEVIEAVGLAERMHYRPTELSGGQQQRVAIARAMVTNPVIILADEPTGNLDHRNGLEILSLFQRLNSEGRTILMITHDVEEALLLADEVWICSGAPMRILDRIEPPGVKPRRADDPALVEARSHILQRLQKEADDAAR